MLSSGKLIGDLLPCNALLHHQDHQMIEQVGNLVFDLLGIRILGGNDNFRRLLSYFLQNLINALVKQIIRVRAFLRVLLAV